MLKTLRSTLKNTAIYSFGTLASKLVGFFLLPLYTTKLSVPEYGVLGILEISGQFLIAFFGLGLYNAFYRWYWDKKYISRQKSILFTLVVLVFSFSVFMTMILWFQDKNISAFLFNTTDYALLVKLMLIISLLEAQNILILTLLRLQEKASLYTILTITKFTVQLVFTIYFMVYRGKKIEAIYLAQIIADILFLILISRQLFKNIIFRFETGLLKDLLKFSLPLLLTSVLAIILTITDRYTLKFLGSLKDVGIYSLGYKLSNFLRTVIISSVNLALYPVIYKMMDVPNNKRFYSKVMTYYLFGLMFFALGLSFFGKEVVKVMARRVEYWEAFTLVPILSFAIVFSALRDVALTGINLTKKTYILARVITFVVIVNLVLNILTIPIWGYLGAAFSTLFSQMLYFIIVYYFSQRVYHIPYETKKVALMIGVGVILVLISQLGNSFGLIWRILFKTGLLIVFPVILYPFHFYEKIEMERLRQIWITWRNPVNWKKNVKRLSRQNSDITNFNQEQT